MTALVICDDEPLVLAEIKRILNECILEYDLPYYIALVSEKPGAVISFVENHSHEPVVCVLDIELGSMLYNGIELGSLLCKACKDIYLIYVSCHTDVAWKTFQHRLRCYDFIPKDTANIKERIKENLALIKKEIEGYGSIRKIIEYKQHTINLDKLLYIETSANQHRLRIVFEDSFIEVWGSLVDVRQILPDSFFFSHRRIIINLEKVEYFSMKEKRIYFQNGMYCDGSVKQLRELKKEYPQYYKRS